MLPEVRHDSALKPRMTERGDMIAMVFRLARKGFSPDDIPVEIARQCYVDLDELNDVMRPFRPAG